MTTTPHYCPNCHGTGADPIKTADMRRRHQIDKGSYIRCWNCNGNGLDPAAYFRWSAPAAPAAPVEFDDIPF